MADTGYKFPSLSSTGTWITPDNAFADDGTYAVSNGLNSEQAWKNFAFGIPAGATIDGIEAVVNGFSSANPDTIEIFLSWDNGVSYTAAKSGTFSGSGADEDLTFGGATDTWGRTWSDTEFSDANFRVKLKEKTNPAVDVANVDSIKIKVFYTTAAGVKLSLTLTGCGV